MHTVHAWLQSNGLKFGQQLPLIATVVPVPHVVELTKLGTDCSIRVFQLLSRKMYYIWHSIFTHVVAYKYRTHADLYKKS